jgi:hypothetical protein
MVRRLQQNSKLRVHRLRFSSAHLEEWGIKGRNIAFDEVTASSSNLLGLIFRT